VGDIVSVAIACSKCGVVAGVDARFCRECGSPLSTSACVSCHQPLKQDARFCTGCGTAVGSPERKPNASALDHLITAIQLLVKQSQPDRILEACSACLQQAPLPSYAALVSVISMSSYARLGDYQKAEAALMKAREFYAIYLGLSAELAAEYVAKGSFIDELRPVGDRAIQETPWLYFILGHAIGPRLPSTFLGDTESERHKGAMEAWKQFFSDLTPIRGALSYLLFASGQYAEAADCLERLILIARRYEANSPVRIEWAWPRNLLGDCYWATGQKGKAADAWQRVRSLELCVSIDSDVDSWGQLAFSSVEQAKSRLSEHNLPVPLEGASLRASRYLQEAINLILEAEQFEAGGADLEELASLIRRAGRRYADPIERAAAQVEMAERLDPYAWALCSINDFPCWFRLESVKALLLQKSAQLQVSNEKLALAVASLKQANDIWPTLSSHAVMGSLQALCGLTADARQTYRICCERAPELGATESSEERDATLSYIRGALGELV